MPGPLQQLCADVTAGGDTGSRPDTFIHHINSPSGSVRCIASIPSPTVYLDDVVVCRGVMAGAVPLTQSHCILG